MKQYLFLWLFFCVALGMAQKIPIPQMKSKVGGVDLLLQNIEANVVGKTVDVRIYQSFQIHSKDSLQYVFPIDAEKSLYELKVYYPDQIFSLDVRNMDNIRKQVVAENKKGKRISIAHSNEPHFLTLDLPDPPIDQEIKVVVKYMEHLEANLTVQSFKMPSLLAKNYQQIPETFQLKVNLISATPIVYSNISLSNAHRNLISEKFHQFTYQGADFQSAITLEFDARGTAADAGMLVYEDKGCRYILGVVEPPKEISPEEIAPREYIFVMDVSGSMKGFPIDTSKELIKRILNDLKAEEKFNILFFDGSSDFLAERSIEATPENKDLAFQIINEQRGKGSTKLSGAMNKVYAYPPDPAYNRIVVMLTDGLLTEDGELYYDLKRNLNFAQYFVFGIGYEVGRGVIQKIANIVGTKAVLITEHSDAAQELDEFYHRIRTPLLRKIEVQSKQLNLRETYPQQFNGFLSSQSSSFVSKECSGMREPKLVLTGINGNEAYHEVFQLDKHANNEDLMVLQLLWAKEKINFLLTEEERCGQVCQKSGKYRNEIIKIGEELNISTPYTSFIEENYQNIHGNLGRKTSLYNHPQQVISFQNDFDSDFDGVPNLLDECPYDKGFLDRKGCPRTKEEKMTEEINRILEGVEFAFDSYEIQAEFYEKLNTAAEIIIENDQGRYIVEGHTDAAGTAEYNLQLSLSRAHAVVNYLKRKGVDVGKLRVVGKGDSELKHPECRPQEVCDDQKNFENRRVVFKQIN